MQNENGSRVDLTEVSIISMASINNSSQQLDVFVCLMLQIFVGFIVIIVLIWSQFEVKSFYFEFVKSKGRVKHF